MCKAWVDTISGRKDSQYRGCGKQKEVTRVGWKLIHAMIRENGQENNENLPLERMCNTSFLNSSRQWWFMIENTSFAAHHSLQYLRCRVHHVSNATSRAHSSRPPRCKISCMGLLPAGIYYDDDAVGARVSFLLLHHILYPHIWTALSPGATAACAPYFFLHVHCMSDVCFVIGAPFLELRFSHIGCIVGSFIAFIFHERYIFRILKYRSVGNTYQQENLNVWTYKSKQLLNSELEDLFVTARHAKQIQIFKKG